MFIENPNKKTSYSFRIKPDLLESIKLYAKATNQKVPEILNEMIENKVKGLHLSDEYLPKSFKENIIISIPPLELLKRENDLINNNESAIFMEVKQIPNNLDIWRENKGYTSNLSNTKHEGIEFVLIPDLLLYDGYNCITDLELMKMALVPIYFRVGNNNEIYIKNISFDNAIKTIRNHQKINVLDTATAVEISVNTTIEKYYKIINNASENFDGGYYCNGYSYINKNEMLKDNWAKLLVELEDITEIINTNVITHLEGAISRDKPTREELLNTTLVNSDPVALWNEIDDLKDELRKSLQENYELKQKLNTMENQVNEVKEIYLQLTANDKPNDNLIPHKEEENTRDK